MIKTTLKIEGMMCSMCEAHICDTIRKAVQRTLNAALQIFSEKEYAGRPGSRADKGDQKSRDDRVHFLPNSPFFS